MYKRKAANAEVKKIFNQIEDIEVKKIFNQIEDIMSLDIADSMKLEDIKTCMNRINTIIPFRENKVSLMETKKIIQELNSTYADFLKLESEAMQLRMGVEIAIKLKEFKQKFTKIIRTERDTKIVEVAQIGETIADNYLQMVYTQACGIIF